MTRIIYLHGFASGPSSTKANYFRERLERAGARVEIPDLAQGDFEHLTITSQLEVIAHGANSEPVALAGSSMGAYLAALYAARHPEVTRLVLMAPAFAFARRWAASLGPSRVEEWRRIGEMEVFHYGEKRLMRLGYGLLEDAQSYEDFPDFRQPGLIFHGANDEVVPAAAAAQFAANHPNVRLEVLDSDHGLLDVLGGFAPRVIAFLTEPERPTV